MKFNSRELSNFIQHLKPGSFDREGILSIKEKHDGLFKKGEVFAERWCQLRGNLLFYHKTKDRASEVSGLLVIERCTVEFDPDEEGFSYSFQLVYEGDNRIQYFAAPTEEERDDWIKALHEASYECLKIKIQHLREQLIERIGRDPLQPKEKNKLEENIATEVQDDEPVIEISLQCNGLPSGNQGQLPNTVIALSVMNPPNQSWNLHGHTEIIERSSSPVFLKTICFSWKAISGSSRIRLTVYDVKERLTETLAQIGHCIFTVQQLLRAQNHRLELTISTVDRQPQGTVIIQGYQEEVHLHAVPAAAAAAAAAASAEHMKKQDQSDSAGACAVADNNTVRNDEPPSQTVITRERTKSLRHMYDNITTRVYRFPTNHNTQLKVYEFMAESKLAFYIPKELLKLWIEEERGRMTMLQDLGELPSEWNKIRQLTQEYHMTTISSYTQILRYLQEYRGPTFKPSSKKDVKEYSFIPTNLHIQGMWVYEGDNPDYFRYDIMTVGAFTDVSRGFKNGGVRRQLHALHELYLQKFHGEPQTEKITEFLNHVVRLRKLIHYHCDGLSRAALSMDPAKLRSSKDQLQDNGRQLIQLCEQQLMCIAVAHFNNAKNSLIPEKSSPSERATSHFYGDASSPTSTDDSNNAFRWSVPNPSTQPAEEPWEMTRSNFEASLLLVTTKAGALLGPQSTQSYQKQTWLEELTPPILKAKSAVEQTCKKALSGLTFKLMQEYSPSVPLMSNIKTRRDAIVSQAVTAVTSGFLTKLEANFDDTDFLRQISKAGILMYFETLLSCHGSEMGMLEDMIVAVNDISSLKFKLVHLNEGERILPMIVKDRPWHGLVIEIPVHTSKFQKLPHELRKGQLIRVVPVIFNVGVNEQATLAEKFGDNSLQELMNAESLATLTTYYEKFVHVNTDKRRSHRNLPLTELMKLIQYNVTAKKSKNVEILQLSEEITRRMNGVRFTSCKSAKDRTAMAATLEQVLILQQEHNLASHEFTHALECMRSEGTRRENSYKNTGARKYAFNSLRVLAMPKLYRPPAGTYGNVQT